MIIWLLTNILYVGPENGWFALSAHVFTLPETELTLSSSAAVPQADSIISQAPSLLSCITGILDPLGKLIGLDGVILTAFILGFPANEIVLPIILMAHLQSGYLMENVGPFCFVFYFGLPWLDCFNSPMHDYFLPVSLALFHHGFKHKKKQDH